MKIRNGFVSNSSSSSFIVAFSKLPESAEELRQMMFGDKELVASYDVPAKTADLAEIVFQDIQAQLDKLPHSRETLADEFASEASWKVYERREKLRRDRDGGYRRSVRNMTEAEVAVREKEWEEDKIARKQLENQMADEMLSDEGFHGKTLLIFDYEDKGDTLVLETGNVFRKFPHRRISNH